MKQHLRKLISLTFIMCLIGSLNVSAQTQLLVTPTLTTLVGTNLAITFRVTNNNSGTLQIVQVYYPLLTGITADYRLYHSTSSITGNPNLSVGWTTDQNVTNVVGNGFYTAIFSGLNIQIPPGQTYRFAVQIIQNGANTPTFVYGASGSTPTSSLDVNNILLETGVNGAGLRFTGPNGTPTQRNYAGGIGYNIIPAGGCSGLPNLGNTVSNSNPVNGCGFTLSTSSSLSGVPGITFQWDSSTVGVGGPYTAIPGATNATYTSPGITASTYYRNNATCSFSLQTGTSTPLQVVYNANPFPEGFESTQFAPNCWTGAVATTNWSRATGISANGVGTGSAKFDFWDIVSGSFDLITPTFTPIGAGQAVVFDVAYATATGEDDQLQISTSSDGGTNYTPLILLHGGTNGTLNTGGSNSATPYSPTAAQWKHVGFDIPAGTNRIKFTAISAFGNNMYLDNINIGSSINDITVTNIYTLGKIPIGFGANHVIQARVQNNSTSSKTPNIALNITGANSFSNVQSPVMGPGDVTIVSFAPFSPTTTGINNISVANTTPDNNAGNDAATFTQTVTQNLYTYKDQTIANTGGVGFTGGTGDFVAKFNAGNNFGDPDTINEIKVDFFGGGQTLQIGIWDATGAGGSPGINVWTSAPFVSPTGTAFISVPNIIVTGGFFCGVRQTGTVNANFAYQSETPIRSGTFYFASPTGAVTWTDFYPNSPFRFSIEPQMKIRIPPNCPVNFSPANASIACPLNPTTLSWFSGGGGATDYNVYFSTNQADVAAHSPAALVSANQVGTSYNTGPLTNGATYYWTIVANNADGGSPGCTVQSFTMGTTFFDCYCIPVHNNACLAGEGIITNVTFNTLNNSTGCSPTGYASYPATTSVAKGSSYNLSVTCDISSIISVWIDWNHNGSLETTEWTQVDVASVPNVASTVSIPIPITALPGNTLMRIRSRLTANPNGDIDACTVFGSGEGEDYTINVTCGTSASNNTPICLNTALHLFSGPDGASYSWSGPSFSSTQQNPTINNVLAGNGGTYSVTVVSTGCNETVNTNVSFQPQPATAATASAPFCDGTANLNLHANASNGTPGYTYVWSSTPSGFSSTSSDPTITPGHPSDSKTYKVIVTDANGCRDSSTASATIYPLPVVDITVVGFANLCTGQTTADLNSTGAVTYLWSTSETGDLITVSTQGTYTVTGTDANGCINTDQQIITESAPPPVPHITPIGPITLCTDGFTTTSVTLTEVNYGSSLIWSNNQTTSSILVDYADAFNVTYTDNNGCTSTSNTVFTFVDNASTAPTGASTTAPFNNICLGSTLTLQQVGGTLGDNAQWKWYEGGCGTGASIATGANPTITPLTAGTHVYYVRAESPSCGNSACGSVTVTVSPSSPIGTVHFTSAGSAGCNGSSASFTVNSVAGASFYNWSGPAGVLFNGSPSPVQTATNTVVATFAVAPPPGASGYNICAFAGNGCTQSNTICTWVRAKVSQPGPISGSIIACATNNLVYSITPIVGADTYTWTVTGSAKINGGTATLTTSSPSITVNFLAGWTSGTLSVYASMNCGFNSTARNLAISSTPAQPGIVTGPSYVCPNSTGIAFSVPVVPGAASYTWTCSVPGSTVFPSANSCTINFPAVIPAGSTVCVAAVSSCGSSSANRCKGIANGTPTIPGNISGPVTGQCAHMGVSYSITPVALATSYSWTASNGATIVGPANLSAVSINFPSSFTNSTITVSASNSCGTSNVRSLVVTGAASQPGVILGTQSVCNGDFDTYTTSGSSGATSFGWTVPAGATILGAPPYGPSILVQWGGTSGNVVVNAVNDCGTSSNRTLFVAVTCRESQLQESAAGSLMLYPNPTSGKVELNFNSDHAENVVMNVTDLLGRNVITESIKAVEGINLYEADLSKLAKGAYMIQLEGTTIHEVVKVTVQ